MTATPKKTAAFARLSPLLCYAGVISGLYLLESGWAAIGLYHLAMCAALAATGGWREARAVWRGWRSAFGLPLAALCLASGALLFLLWPWIHREGADLGEILARLGLHGWPWVAFVAYYSLVNPWIEEIFWRGWYAKQLARPAAADLLFAGYHVFVLLLFVNVGWALVAFAGLAATAAVWRWVAGQTGGIIVPCVTHLLADASIIAAAVALTLG